ncbi:hypothetical protein [Desulfoscipio geothermicus]|uniref:Uncharacterized protein n=1 Tax=Desulfoscipio geothermicus DSM 3669 TaxID=1121426 RepID=A0A1I6DNC0_9FIRM|nr:hypothetical protein [Desulfoscipio geothermicus]SFR06993.1 hypothetical protein SAMN05660706_11420 [Desulfoscipio geothermicus DSM 3669]
MKAIKEFIKDERGDVLQFAAIVAVLIGLFIAGYQIFGPKASESFKNIGNWLDEGNNNME